MCKTCLKSQKGCEYFLKELYIIVIIIFLYLGNWYWSILYTVSSWIWPFVFLLFLARKYDSGEYLNITGITRDQAGDYECSAMNDIASPDTKTVKVVVKCKYISVLATIWLPKQILIYINVYCLLTMTQISLWAI